MKKSAGLQAIRDGQMRRKILSAAPVKPQRHEGSDFDCDRLTITDLVLRAVEKEAKTYHAELTNDGKFVASVLVIRDAKRAQQLLAADRFFESRKK